MARKRLTARTVQTASVGWHCDGAGLYLQVTPGGRSWVLRYRVPPGRERYMGLGSALDLSLAEAREKALAARRLRIDGVDPIESRRTQRQAARLESAKQMTFGQCVEAYLETHEIAWKNPNIAINGG